MAKKLRVKFMQAVRAKEEKLNLDRRLTNKEIADAVGLSENAVGRWARGEVRQVNFELLEKLCEYFDCEISDLLVIEDLGENRQN